MGQPHATTDGEPPDADRWEASAPKAIDPLTGQHKAYWILPDAERAKGFVRPLRRSYRHVTCGSMTTMGQAIAETYAVRPRYYSATMCCNCLAHFPVAEFRWIGADGRDTDEVLGS